VEVEVEAEADVEAEVEAEAEVRRAAFPLFDLAVCRLEALGPVPHT
jgi:hypothetical protein